MSFYPGNVVACSAFLVICNQEFYVVNVKIMWLEQHVSYRLSYFHIFLLPEERFFLFLIKVVVVVIVVNRNS